MNCCFKNADDIHTDEVHLILEEAAPYYKEMMKSEQELLEILNDEIKAMKTLHMGTLHG